MLADRAYDADWLAGKSKLSAPRPTYRRWRTVAGTRASARYRGRNRIERFFNRIKPFRRLATRYEKHAAHFLAMFKLAAAQLWMRHNQCVA